MDDLLLQPIGYILSEILTREHAPCFEDENAPSAIAHISCNFTKALSTLEAKDEITLITWLHLADRNTLEVFPRGDTSKTKRGVFNTRSADRPNPIGLHTVIIQEIEYRQDLSVFLHLNHIETLDKTPILDIKTSREQREKNKQRKI
ncbi:MAG: tRNA (N6-threonylcarbamoyladenosine(37)-N6)-methyltransferase TrmO [Desulfovibrionaceae bacterium]